MPDLENDITISIENEVLDEIGKIKDKEDKSSLKLLAYKDKVSVPSDLDTQGAATEESFLRGDGEWAIPPSGGGGELPKGMLIETIVFNSWKEDTSPIVAEFDGYEMSLLYVGTGIGGSPREFANNLFIRVPTKTALTLETHWSDEGNINIANYVFGIEDTSSNIQLNDEDKPLGGGTDTSRHGICDIAFGSITNMNEKIRYNYRIDIYENTNRAIIVTRYDFT